jgi:hypothetical protein
MLECWISWAPRNPVFLRCCCYAVKSYKPLDLCFEQGYTNMILVYGVFAALCKQ